MALLDKPGSGTQPPNRSGQESLLNFPVRFAILSLVVRHSWIVSLGGPLVLSQLKLLTSAILMSRGRPTEGADFASKNPEQGPIRCAVINK